MFLYSTRDFAETISIVADIEPVAYNRSHYNTNHKTMVFFEVDATHRCVNRLFQLENLDIAIISQELLIQAFS